MYHRSSTLACAAVLLAASSLAAQMPSKALRTADGQPDLQGVWNFSTITPLERTAEFSGREFLTDAETKAFEQRTAAAISAASRRNVSGNAGTVTGGVYTTGNQTIAGTKTFSSPIAGDITGNAATVTSGVYTTGSYADPAFITSLAGSKISGNIAGSAANVTGTEIGHNAPPDRKE